MVCFWGCEDEAVAVAAIPGVGRVSSIIAISTTLTLTLTRSRSLSEALIRVLG
jgi:hypothetical protein